MSSARRSGAHDLLYSEWHRSRSTERFLGKAAADDLGLIDVDGVEYCTRCYEPLALIETQRSGGAPKPATVTTRLAIRANLPAFSVSYFACPAQQPISDYVEEDILRFVVRRLHPLDPEARHLSPEAYAGWLYSLRTGHRESGECGR